MTNATYVAYCDEVEKQRPDEDELITRTVKALRRGHEQAYKRYKPGVRDQHAKTHGVLRGELTVYPDLASHLRQGLFATPATYPVIARISTAGGEIRSDQVHELRGMAIKVLGVHGPKVLPEDDGVTQDFLLVRRPTSRSRRSPFRRRTPTALPAAPTSMMCCRSIPGTHLPTIVRSARSTASGSRHTRPRPIFRRKVNNADRVEPRDIAELPD
jgi:hypothetical protein